MAAERPELVSTASERTHYVVEVMEARQFSLEMQPPRALPFAGLALGPPLGRGSFGTVYKGTFEGTTIAVKVGLPTVIG